MKFGPLNSVLERMGARVINEPVMESEERNKSNNFKEDKSGNRKSNAIEGVYNLHWISIFKLRDRLTFPLCSIVLGYLNGIW